MHNKRNIRYDIVIEDEVHSNLKLYSKIFRNGVYYIFIGPVTSKEQVPKINCIYIFNGKVFVRKIERTVKPVKVTKDLVNKLKRLDDVDDGTMLNIKVEPEDDHLMILIKLLLIQRKVTVKQFKDMYGDRVTDMSNAKQRLENKHTLSFGKFREILKLMNLSYNIDIFEAKENGDEN